MKNKAFLSILEQLCMILIFAIASAVCLRVFYSANNISKSRDTLDQAVIAAQNTAELLKSTKGDLQACAAKLEGIYDNNVLTIYFSDSAKAVNDEGNAHFMLVARLKDDDHPLTESAQISVFQKNEIIFEIEAVWQIGGPGDEN